MDYEQMVEDVKSIRNECDIILALYYYPVARPELKELYPAILENIAIKAQSFIDDYCITRGGNVRK